MEVRVYRQSARQRAVFVRLPDLFGQSCASWLFQKAELSLLLFPWVQSRAVAHEFSVIRR
jgi:hypothetical protein